MGFAARTLAAALVIAAMASPASAGVYDDVAAWWHFDYDPNSNNMVDSTDEIRDQRGWGTTSTPHPSGNHADAINGDPEWVSTGFASGPAGGQPYGGTALKLSPTVDVDGITTTADGFFVDEFAVTGSLAMVTRFKWDGYTTSVDSAWLLNNNFQYGDPTTSAGGGFLFGLTGANASPTILFGSQNSVSAWTTTQDVWYDVALVINDDGASDSITMYRWAEGGDFQQQTFNVNYINDTTFNGDTRVGYESAGPNDGNAPKSFSGEIDHMALWDRALDVDEVNHAFGAPQPVFQLGINNDTNVDLRLEGEANKTTYAIGDPWHEAARAVSSGSSSSANFNFDLDAVAAGFNYIFHLNNQTPQSGNDFTINAAVNGNPIGSYTVNSAGDLVWNVSADLLTAGTNTLTLSRDASSVAAYMAWDWMELSGAWQLGLDNGNNAEFAPEAESPDDFFVTNPDTGNDLERAVVASDPETHLHFELSEIMAGYGYIYSTEIIQQSGQHPLNILVNGMLVTTLPAAGNNTKFDVVINHSLLNAGDNVITIQWADGDAGGWTQFDYHRLTLIPEPGAALLLAAAAPILLRRRR